MQASNEASQFLETRQYQVIEICRAYRVDPSYVQDKTKVGYASQEQAAIDLVQQTLLPWFRRWESAITRDLVVKDDVFFAEFDTRGLLRGDLAAQANWLQTMLNTGIYSINECREVLNMNPIGADGDQRYMQMNLTTMQGIAATASVGNAGDPAPADNLPVSYTDELLSGPAMPANDATPDQPAAGDPAVAAEPQIADLSLNGAQVSSLLEIVDQYNAGLLNEGGAKAIIAAAFPGIPQATVNAIIAGTNTIPIVADEAAVPAPAVKPAPTRSRRKRKTP